MSACTKFKEHRGQAQQGRLKHLLVTALFGRNEGRQIAGLPSPLCRKTHGKKNKKNTFCEKFLRACADGAQVRHLAQKALFKHLLLTAARMLLLQGDPIFR